MKRLVYTPKVNAYVKTDYGIFDISEYITEGDLQRKLDQVSSAKITLRNPDKKWTKHHYVNPVTKEEEVGPIFHPMDPITIIMTRLNNRPIQVFTGYLDSTPYFHLFPGTVTLQASCTLKRLLHTYFDPGLPFFEEFLVANGWQVTEGVGITHPSADGSTAFDKGAVKDSGFGELLLAVLKQIGGWNEDTIYIEKIPNGLIELVSNLFEPASKAAAASNEELTDLLHKLIGTASLGSGGGIPASNDEFSPVSGSVTGTNMTPAHAEFVSLLAGYVGLSLKVIGAWVAYENGPDDNPLNIGPGHSYGTVKAGAKATADLLKTSSYYQGIMASVGKSDQDQVAAISASPWCPDCPGYEEALLSLLSDIKVVR